MAYNPKKAATETILSAGKYLKKNLGKIKRVSFKGAVNNLVTNLDREAEAIIIGSLQKRFPDDGFLAEETGEIEGRSGLRWIIDPIDGTTNFAHNFPFYAISVALEEGKKSILGLVYDPERDELFSAQTGRGARLNDKPIRVTRTSDLKKCLLATGFSYKIADAKDNNIAHFKDLLFASQAIRRAGSASLDLCYVACGRFDGFWELDLNPWDTAAGYLIVKEAGGEVSTFDGNKYNPYLKEVLATNGKIHKKISRILTSHR